ncbi:hypothetical protein [Pseudooceanicola sp. 200-1SW]|uniref:hypothetical protein n=1 Tax=Pseudooceanicola sp. 200-1SW TaxID=3425949 RepID=UPI003D7FDF66
MTPTTELARAKDLPVYLVLEGDLLVATDISDALSARGPCRVVHVTTPEEVAAAIATEPVLAAAFVEMRLAALREAGLAEALAARGAQMILTTGEADLEAVLALGWFMLLRPFSDEMIRAVLPAQPAL